MRVPRTTAMRALLSTTSAARRQPTPRNKILVDAIRKGPLFQWKEGATESISSIRADFEQQMEKMPNELLEKGAVHIAEEASAPHSCEWVVPITCAPDSPVILYLHGGGFVAGSSRTHRVLGSQMSSRSCGEP